MVRRFLLEYGIAEPGIADEQQVLLGLDQRPLAVDPLVQRARGQQPGAVKRCLPHCLDGIPGSPVAIGERGIPRQHPGGVPAVGFGRDVGGHVDVVDDETLEVACEVDVAAVAVDDLEAADFAIADLEAREVAQVDAGSTELVTLGVLSRHRRSLSNQQARMWHGVAGSG